VSTLELLLVAGFLQLMVAVGVPVEVMLALRSLSIPG
jgi:hypothetical protein